MKKSTLKQYEGWLFNRIPLLGSWLRGKALAALRQDGSPPCLGVLAKAAAQDDDHVLRAQALEAVHQLARQGSADARDTLCRLVLEHDHPEARAAALADGYAPKDEADRAVFYFLTEQWERYEALDFQQKLLRQALNDGDAALRRRIAARARQSGRVPWMDPHAGQRQGRRLAEMTPQEWEVVLAALGDSGRWQEVWLLAQEAPACWAIPLLRRLAQSGWHPPADADRPGYDRLTRLALAWQGRDEELRSLVPCRAVLQAHDGAVYCLAISPDGKHLASGGGDNLVRLARLPDGAAVRTLVGHSYVVTQVVFSPDGRRLASVGSSDLCLWSVPEGELLFRFRGTPDGRPERAMFTPDGATLVFLANGREARRVDIAARAELEPLNLVGGGDEGHEVDEGNLCRFLLLTPDGKTLLASDGLGAIERRGFPGGEQQDALQAEVDTHFIAAALTADGTRLVAGTGSNRVCVWRLPDGALLHNFEQPGIQLCLGHGTDGRLIIASYHSSLYQPDSNLALRCLPGEALVTLTGHERSITALAITPDDRLLASASSDGTVRLWGLPDGRPLKVLEHDRSVECLAITPDGKLLASGSRDRTVRLWGLEVLRLADLPAGRAPLELIGQLEESLHSGGLAAGERAVLEFLLAHLRWRRRHDITLEPARRIEVGEFDIVIDG